MPAYKVLVTRDCTEHTYIHVFADSIAEAEDAAMDHLAGIIPPHECTWFPDAGSGDAPYIADPGNCATLIIVNTWHDDPTYPSADWRYEVANEDTRLGYLDWVRQRREADRGDR